MLDIYRSGVPETPSWENLNDVPMSNDIPSSEEDEQVKRDWQEHELGNFAILTFKDEADMEGELTYSRESEE